MICFDLLCFLLCAVCLPILTWAYDNSRYDNVAVYWGQNSYGAVNSNTANWQKPVGFYCEDDSIDAFPIAFLNEFFSTGNLPALDLANTCSTVHNATFPGTALPDCSGLASDIQACQAKGKILTISLGGAAGSYGFTGDAQATQFAQTIWDLFLGGSSSTRPFGSAVLDGVDLDIEGGQSTGYVAFINKIQSLASGASKQYYITGAPQCPYPDANMGSTLNSAKFDAVYVQFYNNVCGLQNANLTQDWNFGLWDNWARNISLNPDVKIFIGAPGSSTAAGTGYTDIATLSNIATQMRKSFPSFGGVMLWDASQAYANNRYDKATKAALTAAGGTGFTFPTCSAQAYSSGTTYQGGSQVSFNGYIWQASFSASSQPSSDPNGEWSAISACAGGSDTGSSSASRKASGTSKPTATATGTSQGSATSTASPGLDCSNVSTWSSQQAYNSTSEVVYAGHLWHAMWWTADDVPGGTAGVWTDEGTCASTSTTASPNKNFKCSVNIRSIRPNAPSPRRRSLFSYLFGRRLASNALHGHAMPLARTY